METPNFPLKRDLKLKESREFNTLPTSLDKRGTLFSYGSLLLQDTLRSVLKSRRLGFSILEASNIKDAKELVDKNPEAVVILPNVEMSGVRVDVISEDQLRKWYKQTGGDINDLIQKGAFEKETQPRVILYARTAQSTDEPRTRSRYLNGGLIFGLSEEEVRLDLDAYEADPVYKRAVVPELKINNEKYTPQNVTYYGAGVDLGKAEGESALVNKLLLGPEGQGRKLGTLKNAQWKREVR